MKKKDFIKRLSDEGNNVPDNRDKILREAKREGLISAPQEERVYNGDGTAALVKRNRLITVMASVLVLLLVAVCVSVPFFFKDDGPNSPILSKEKLGDDYAIGAVTTAKLLSSFGMADKQSSATPLRAKKASLTEREPSVDAQIENFESYFGAFGTFFGVGEDLVEVSNSTAVNPKYPNSIVIAGRYANGEKAEYALYYLEALDIKNSTDNENRYYLEGEIFIDKVYYYLEGSRTFSTKVGAEAENLELRAYSVKNDRNNYVQMKISSREVDGNFVKSYDYKIFKNGAQLSESISFLPVLDEEKAFDLVLNYGGDDSVFTVSRPEEGQPILTVGYEIGTKRSSFKVNQTRDKAVWIITDNYICVLNETKKTCEITGYRSDLSIGDTLLVPDEINGYKVTQIGYEAFKYRSEIEKVVIPETVEIINTRAFAYCQNIQEVEFNEGLIQIGYDAFSGCTALKSIAIPASVNTISSSAFYHCCNLESITVAEGNANFTGKGNCLINMSNLYGDGKLYGNVYQGCANSVIPQDLNINSISDDAFYSTKIKSVTLPSTLSYMGSSAFERCTELEEIVIPEKLGRIERDVFYGCTKLNKITIPDKEIGIAAYAFYDTGYENDLNNWDMENGYRALYIGKHLINLVLTDDVSIPVDIKSGTLTIAQSAFENNMAFRYGSGSITLNRELLLIDDMTLMGGSGFLSIQFAEGSDTSLSGRYVTSYNCLIDTYTQSIIAGCDGSAIPEDYNVVNIAPCAFAGCSFDSFVIPDNIRTISMDAFAYCRNLQRIVISASVSYIADFAFLDCHSLKTVTFEEPAAGSGYDIVNLEMGACFVNCDELEGIEIPARAGRLGGVFADCDNLENLIIIYNDYLVIHGLAENCRNLNMVTFSGTSEQWKRCYQGNIEHMAFSVKCMGDGVILTPDYHE